MTFRSGRRRAGLLLSGAATAFLLQAAPALAVDAVGPARTQAATGRQFNIPAGPLDIALNRFSEQSGQQLVYDTQLVRGLRSRGVRGRMDANSALAALLAGQGLAWRNLNATTITIERMPQAPVEDDGSRVLGPIRVEGSQSTFAYSGGPARGDGVAQLGGVRGGQDEEATGYRPNVATIGGLSPVAIEDNPRSISVLTQEQIEKQDIRDLGDALRRLPGIALLEEPSPSLTTGTRVLSRGFDISTVQLDGGAARPLNILNNGALDLGAYERVELVRGPNGVFSGAGSPGGALNLVRKRPGEVEAAEITATLGSQDRQTLQLDYSTPSLNGSPFAFRGVGSVSDRNSVYSRGSLTNALLYGMLDAPLGDKARFELGAQYSVVREDSPYSGAFRYTGGELIDFGDYYANITPSWAYDDFESAGLFSRLYIDISDTIDLQVGLDYERARQDRQRMYLALNFIEGSGLSTFSYASALKENQETSNLSFDFKLTGNTTLWGLKHAWFVAGELTESGAEPSQPYSGQDFIIFSNLSEVLPVLDGPEPGFYPFGSNDELSGTATRAGLVIGDVISWRDKIELTFSARRYFTETSSFSIARNIDTGEVSNITIPHAGDREGRGEAEWVPSWSLAFKPTRQITLYGTRSEGREEIITPRYTVDGDTLGPSTYENVEGGVKFATDRWLATLAYYDMVQENVAQQVPGSSCPPTNTISSPCYLAQGATVESRGVDLEFAGELFTGVNLSANYTWGKVESTATGANASTQTPVHAAQIFVDWSPSFSPRTSIRAGVRYRGEVYQSGSQLFYDPVTGVFAGSSNYDFTEDPYFVFDAGIRHQITDQISLDLFAENITDERYLSTISAGAPNIPGAPRTVVATLRWKPALNPNGPRSTTGLAPFGDPADWYAAVETGLHASDDLDAKGEGVSMDGATPVRWTFGTEDRAIALARLGYRLSPQWRAEIEGSFRSAIFTDIGGGLAAPFGVCSVAYADLGQPFDCDKADGDLSNWTLMLNGVYDFGSSDARLRPFAGIGIGTTRASIDFAGKMEGVGQDTPWNGDPRRHTEEAIGGDTARMALAYQLLAGVSYRLSDQATIEAAYRYHAVPGLKWGSYNLEGVGGYPAYGEPWPALTGRVGDFDANFQDHSLTVGLRWAFGVR